MSTSRASMNMSTTRKNARQRFRELRAEGRNPILYEGKERLFVGVPAKEQPGEFVKGNWMGCRTYEGEDFWFLCEELLEFEVSGEVEAKVELGELGPGLSFEEYEEKFGRIKDYLRDGDSYQVNFAHEFGGEFSGDPFDLYEALYFVNPVEHAFFMERDGVAIVSNSPERLVSLKSGVLRAEPIKGTIAVGEDEALLDDEKVKAELTMIVDLLRNDLAMVSEVGSVEVVAHRALMHLANVTHTYSVIESRLKAGLSAWDVLDALFPGGSVTGCPKKRTMEIIKEMEGFERGAYCGSAGIVFENGDADFNIMIRTATLKGDRLVFPVGGGIVMDSEARAEYEESLAKADVLKKLC